MKSRIFFCIVLCLYFGCDLKNKPPLNGIVQMIDKASAGTMKREYEYKDGKVVRYTEFYSNGKKKYEALKANPAINQWSTDESDISEFYESGQQKEVNHFKADSVITKTDWFENGRTQMEFSRTTGKKDKGVRYYSDGKRKEEFEFVNEQRHGIWAEWDSVGNQIRKEYYVKGILSK